MIERVVLIVLDSLGVGALPDAINFGDEGSNTLANVAKANGGLKIPNLESLGIGNLGEIEGVRARVNSKGAYGKMAEKSVNKDTTTGHWEIAGLLLDKPFPVYPAGFPPEIMEPFKQQIGMDVLGNIPASGTEIIEILGTEHLRTGKPIIYTSADSVFQVAAHEEIIPVEQLYGICRTARKILTGKHAVGRVIARPFIGDAGHFKRTANRCDFSLQPPADTVLDNLLAAGKEVAAIGKIEDIFTGRGISSAVHTSSNMDGLDKITASLKKVSTGLIFANLVDFDSLYGHRNDPKGYAAALEEFDRYLPAIEAKLTLNDVLVITADHGCDPTAAGTDHTREYVPLLIEGTKIRSGINLGVRQTFADVGATVAELLGAEPTALGVSMVPELLSL